MGNGSVRREILNIWQHLSVGAVFRMCYAIVMEKVTIPHFPQDDQYIFTDGINYHETGDVSIWGTEENVTVQALSAIPGGGRWLNVCAGDGRFNERLLRKAEEVVALDIDASALSKLWHSTPEDLREKLVIQTSNVVEPLPFENTSFNGVFCTGTLHMFPRQILQGITAEFDRVLRSGGSIILDYATDIRRELPDGSLHKVVGEPNLTLEEGKQWLQDCFDKYSLTFVTSAMAPEEVVMPGRRWMFSSNFIFLTGIK